MGAHKSERTRQAEFTKAAEGMYVRLRQWRAEHLDASFDEIGEQVTCERKGLMAQLLGELAAQPEEVTTATKELCAQCGREVCAKGKRSRGVSHMEGDIEIEREYYLCGTCHRGFFPPGQQTAVDGAYLESTDD